MPDYMLVLRDDRADFAGITPEEMQRIIEKYRAWAGSLRESGRLVGSDKLVDGAGRVMRRGKAPLRVTDGPFAEGKEIFGGFFTVRAGSYEEACKLAEGCPHLDYGGSVEVREIAVMCAKPTAPAPAHG
jgi:hypothetical protein